MTSNTIQGIEVYEHYSKGIWGLAGDSMRDTRQRLMYLITGESLPKAKCGVTALEVAYRAAKSHVEAIDQQTQKFVAARMTGRPVSFRYADGTHETFNMEVQA